MIRMGVAGHVRGNRTETDECKFMNQQTVTHGLDFFGEKIGLPEQDFRDSLQVVTSDRMYVRRIGHAEHIRYACLFVANSPYLHLDVGGLKKRSYIYVELSVTN